MADQVRLYREQDKFTSAAMPRKEAEETIAGYPGMYELLEAGELPKAYRPKTKPSPKPKTDGQ